MLLATFRFQRCPHVHDVRWIIAVVLQLHRQMQVSPDECTRFCSRWEVQRVHVRRFRSKDPAFCKEIDRCVMFMRQWSRSICGTFRGQHVPQSPGEIGSATSSNGLSPFPGQVKRSSVNQIINARISSCISFSRGSDLVLVNLLSAMFSQ